MVNVTVDDSASSVIYYPSGAWNARSASDPCSTCTANPDADRMFDNTFHDGTFNPLSGSNDYPNVPLTASIVFNASVLGTAVYVYCALAESSTSPDGDSDMSFYIDGSLKGTFVKTAPGNNNVYDYAIPVFSIDSLSVGMHNFTLQNGHVNGTKSLVLLDEIIYTTVDDISSASSSSQSSTTITSASSSASQSSSARVDDANSAKKNMGAVIGPAVAVPIVVLLLAVFGICFFLKRRKRQQPQGQRATIDSPGPVAAAWTVNHPASLGPGGTALSSRQQLLNTEPEHPDLAGANPYNPYSPTQVQSSAYLSSVSGIQPDPDVHNTSSAYISSASGLTHGINPDPDVHNTATSASFSMIDGELPPAYDDRYLKAGGASLRVKERKTTIMNR
ncbi:hypothetical protein C8R41DRAFT_915489 [Lentinula lateritia]|uniref:Uncharacterized protein n=1 Tax=Lentinula lateritia TaxID=40482 RepID=A0ABQ8VSH7_9AGAR|nr:hypothetical protein C8R41DRAFT_915489 [Lentinula lateritia]